MFAEVSSPQTSAICRHAASLLLSTAVGAAAHHLLPLPRCLRTLSAPSAALQHLRHVPTSRLINRIKHPVDAVYARFARKRRPVIHQGGGATVVLIALASSPASKGCVLHPPRHGIRVCHLAALPSLTFAAVRCWLMCFAEMPPAKSKPHKRSKSTSSAHAAPRAPKRAPPRAGTGRWAVLPAENSQAANPPTAEPAAGAGSRRSRRRRRAAGEGAGASSASDHAQRSVTPPPPAVPAVHDSPEARSTGNKSPDSKRRRAGHASPARGVIDGMDVDAAGQASVGDSASSRRVPEPMRAPNFDSSDEDAPPTSSGTSTALSRRLRRV